MPSFFPLQYGSQHCIMSCRILIQGRSGSMYMGETKPHQKLSAMPVLLLAWLPYDVITLDSFTLKSNRGQAIQQCFRNMFTGIPTITHFWHIIQNTERERERESHAGIITHGDHILLALIVAELVSGMVQQFVFNPSGTVPITK